MKKIYLFSVKIPNLLEKVRKCIESGNYILTNHALVRKEERVVTEFQIEYVLKNGFHEEQKDKWDEKYHSWNYAIRGSTPDKDNLRVIVSFDNEDMLIITVIRLIKKE